MTDAIDYRRDMLDAIELRTPARIPFTYSARKETDEAFRAYLGLPEGETVPNHYKCNRFASPWSIIGDRWRLPDRSNAGRESAGGEETITDIWGCVRVKTEYHGGYYYELCHAPLADAESAADVEAYDWPRAEDIVWPEMPEGLDLAEAKKDVVVQCMDFIFPFGVPWSMRGMEKFMMDLALNPDIVETMVRKCEEFGNDAMRMALEKYPGLIDLVGSGDDYGTQNGLFLSKDMIDRFFMPSLEHSYSLAARYGVKGYHHCCGAITEIIPSFIDAGLNVLNPVQTSAAGMDPQYLKREFGKDLCFHGSIDIQQTLVHGGPADVKAEAKSRVETLGPDGFILGPTHVLQPDTPMENLAALYEAANEYC